MNKAAERMALTNVRTGKRPAPDRIMVLGTEGVGKSTFASAAPTPIYIAAEDGIRHLDVASFPEPHKFAEVEAALIALGQQEHDYQTVVIDTVDWLEPIIWEIACADNKWKNIEEPGFQTGPTVALDYWRRILSILDRLRLKKGMGVILLAHTTISSYRNPKGPDYDRFFGKLNKKAYGLLKEWVDIVLFADFEEFTVEGKGFGKGKFKGVSSGRRVMHTQRTAAFDAKNRYDLPDTLPLSYAELTEAKTEEADTEALAMEAVALLGASGRTGGVADTIRKAIEQNKNNSTNLRRIIDRLRTHVHENTEKEA